MPNDSAPRPAARHVAGLDGLRALAVAAVVVYHFQSSALPGGFLGVDLFFVISGYLITRLLVVEYLGTGGISIVNFYRRRARRLLPALAVLVATVSGAALIWRDQLATLRPAVFAAATYVSNWWLIGGHQSYFVSTGRPSMLQHLWSLAVEEQFYLLWPAAMALILGLRSIVRRRDPPRIGFGARLQRVHRLAVAATVLGLCSAAWMALGAVAGDVPYGADGSRLYYGTDTHCLGLLLGAAIGARAGGRAFVASRTSRTAAARTAAPWLGDIVGAVALLGFFRLTGTLNEYRPELFRSGFLVASLLACVVIAAVTRPGSVLGAALEWRPLRWVGARSYGIYLWHWPVAVVTRPGLDLNGYPWLIDVLRAALTIGLAAASYRWIEQPIRTGGMHLIIEAVAGLPRHRALAVTVTTLLTVALGVVLVNPRPPHSAAQLPNAADTAVPTAAPPHPAPSPLRVPAQANSTTTVATAPTPIAAQVSAFGDSVMLGARLALEGQIPGVQVDAVEGRQARPLLAEVRQLAAAAQLAPVVVIHTGNNGILSPADLTATLQALTTARRVLVLTDRVDRNWQDPNNSTIATVVPRFPNALVIDWHATANGHPEWFWNDGLHLRPAGSAAYAALIAAALAR